MLDVVPEVTIEVCSALFIACHTAYNYYTLWANPTPVFHYSSYTCVAMWIQVEGIAIKLYHPVIEKLLQISTH